MHPASGLMLVLMSMFADAAGGVDDADGADGADGSCGVGATGPANLSPPLPPGFRHSRILRSARYLIPHFAVLNGRVARLTTAIILHRADAASPPTFRRVISTASSCRRSNSSGEELTVVGIEQIDAVLMRIRWTWMTVEPGDPFTFRNGCFSCSRSGNGLSMICQRGSGFSSAGSLPPWPRASKGFPLVARHLDRDSRRPRSISATCREAGAAVVHRPVWRHWS